MKTPEITNLATLQNAEVCITVGGLMAMSLSEQVRLRIREEMARRDLSQRDVANLVNWSQSNIAHILTGRVKMCVDDLPVFAFALGLQPTELVRDRGLEFVAEMTPSELRLFEKIRALTPDQRAALMTILGVSPDNARRALPVKDTGPRRRVR